MDGGSQGWEGRRSVEVAGGLAGVCWWIGAVVGGLSVWVVVDESVYHVE